ncbi:sensor histidine kinase KdpD [Moritella sp. 28]|uniref:sensor histidine kinase n=1 Tax=Moritella sp. 28 TaxID=2746232 RepID=UPI001BA8A231|nr:HAMP domain-containing sensor histidine kinase [Moritella sp. 28]QUM86255.1 HAMP domain-containing histidine kinase [Moritella sp. 28]
MKTFITQVFTSVILGYIVSSIISDIFINPQKEALEDQLNLNRVEMVIEGLENHDNHTHTDAAVWQFQCNIDSNYAADLPLDNLHSITSSHDDVKFIRATFDSEAYANAPVVKELKTIELIDDAIQILCTLMILLISLRAWSNGIMSLHFLSESYSEGKFKTRVEETGPESIRSLIRNQHKMASAIDELIIKQKMLYATLPHDIRTPLAAIQLTSDILVSNKGNNEFLLERLGTQVCSLNTLCESSLHLFKLLNKEVVLCQEKINLVDVLESTISTLGGHKNFELVNCSKTIQSDAKLLKILFLNILSNAERYANETILISLTSYPNVDVVKIKDDGKGFTEKTISAVNNGDIANILSKDGFGIGLVLIFELTKLLNGQVFLHNNSDGGQVTLVMSH